METSKHMDPSQEDKKGRESKQSKQSIVLLIIYSILGFAVTIGLFYFTLYHGDRLPLPVPPNLMVSTKLGYAIKCLVLPAFFVFLAILGVSSARGKSKIAWNPLARGGDDEIKIEKNVLQNTLEQFLVFAFLLLALSVSAMSMHQLKFVPVACLLFFLGRVLFRLGYGIQTNPGHRVLGYSINFSLMLLLFMMNAYLVWKNGFLSGLEDSSPTLSGSFKG